MLKRITTLTFRSKNCLSYICVCIYICVCVYISIYLYISIYIYILKKLRGSTNTKFEVLILFLNCSIVDLQHCVSFRDIAKRLMY